MAYVCCGSENIHLGYLEVDGNSRELTGQFVGASNKSSKGEKGRKLACSGTEIVLGMYKNISYMTGGKIGDRSWPITSDTE